MLQLFYVHSNITIYLAKFYIDLNRIDPSDIIVLYDRLTAKDVEVLPGRKFVFSEEFKNIHLNHKNFWPSFRATRTFINKEVKESYFFFVPHIFTESLQLFASNKKCKKIIYIEEGDMSYFSKAQLNNRFYNQSLYKNISRKVFSFGFLFKKHPFPKTSKKEEAICLNEDAFPFLDNEKHVYNFKDVFHKKQFGAKEKYDNSVVFLLDPFYPKGKEESEKYYTTLRNAFIYVKKRFGKKVYFKPHPVLSSNASQIKLILEISSECELKGELISTPVEFIISNSFNVKVFTHLSSLIRYCFYANVKPYFWGYSLIREIQEPTVKFLRENQTKIEWISENP